MQFLKKKNAKKIWLVTYICVLLIPTIANAIISSFSFYEMNEEIINYNKLYLSKLAMEIDNVFMENSSYIKQLEKDSQLKAISALSKAFDSNSYSSIFNFINSKTMEGSVKIYLKNSEAILEKQAIAKGIVAYNAYPFDPALTYDEWKRIMKSTYNHEYMVLNGELYEFHTLFSETGHEANVIMPIEKRHFLWTTSSKVFPDGINIALCTSDGSVLFENNDVDLSGINLSAVKRGTASVHIGESDNVLCYQKSDVLDFVYVISVPNEHFFKSVKNMLGLEIGIVLISLLLGVMVSVAFTAKNYRPLKRLVENLGGNNGVEEYKYIDHVFSGMNERYSKIIRRKFVAQLLANKTLLSPEIYDSLEEYGISELSNVTAVIIDVVDDEEFFGKNSERRDAELLYVAIENVFCEVAENNDCKAYFTDYNGRLSVLLNVGKTASAEKLLEEADDVFENIIGIKCTLCSGETFENPEDINLSYTQACQVLEFMHFTEETGVGIFSPKITAASMLEEKKAALFKVLTVNGEIPEIYEFVDNILAFGLYKPAMHTVSTVLYELSSLILRIYCEKGGSDSLFKTRIKSLTEEKTLKNFLDNTAYVVESIRNDKETESNAGAIIKIKEYIDKNYHNSQMDNRLIAENSHISANYISKYFKEQTGEKISNYITRLRVQKAKFLLANTDKTVFDIATEVGFYNALALIRAFKKTEGITPTQYREISAKEE